MLQNFFQENSIRALKKIPVPRRATSESDTLVWLGETSENFSVKSSYLTEHSDRFDQNYNTPSGHGSATHTTPGHTETASPHTLGLQTTSTQHVQSSSQADWLSILIKGLHQRISRFENVLYSTNNQVQMRLTTIETQLDAIQRKLEESL